LRLFLTFSALLIENEPEEMDFWLIL